MRIVILRGGEKTLGWKRLGWGEGLVPGLLLDLTGPKGASVE